MTAPHHAPLTPRSSLEAADAGLLELFAEKVIDG